LKVVVLFGPPGAGKGTQASFLASRLGAKHVSTGGLLREQIASKSPLGCRIKALVEAGSLVDDATLFEALAATVAELSVESDSILVLDGVPRTESQVSLLEASLSARSLHVDKVLYISAPVQKLVARFVKRWACKGCGTVFAFDTAQAAESAACATCGAKSSMFRRADDAPETVERRFRVYEEETLPVIAIYRARDLLVEIDGLESPEHVYARVVSEVFLK